MAEIKRNELDELFYEDDVTQTLEFNLYSDNDKILSLKNDIFPRVLRNYESELDYSSKKDKFIIKFLEHMVLGYWLNLGRNELDDNAKQICIEKLNAINFDNDNLVGRVQYLTKVLRQIFNSLNKANLDRVDHNMNFIVEITNNLLVVEESFYTSDQLISIDTNKDFSEEIYDLLSLFDKVGTVDEDLYLNLKVRFKNMSSGEMEFVNGFSNLYTAIQIAIENKEIDTILLLLDEPDASFHPEWSRRYIHNIYKFLNSVDYGKELKFQVIITTHSPFIVSDVPKEHITCINIQKDTSGNTHRIAKKAEFGFMSNFYDIIQSDFFITSPIGEHAKYLFEKTIKRITSWDEYDEHEIDIVNGIISSIGEDMIRAKLQQLLNDKKRELSPSKERKRRIYELEMELNILRNSMDENKYD